MSKKGCLFAGLYVLGTIIIVSTLGTFVEEHRNQIPGRAAVHNALMWLSFIAFVCLLVGLIAPKVFTRLLQAKATRKYVAYIFGTAFVVFFMFGIQTVSDAEKAEREKLKLERKKAAIASKPTTIPTRSEKPKFLAENEERERDAKHKEQAEEENRVTRGKIQQRNRRPRNKLWTMLEACVLSRKKTDICWLNATLIFLIPSSLTLQER